MPSSRWNYVDVNCLTCAEKGTIRIDQYNRKNKQWICRSCAFTGRKLKVKNPSAKHDILKVGAYKSYCRAKKESGKTITERMVTFNLNLHAFKNFMMK